MSERPDNPPAFPLSDGPVIWPGMTLRDWFAGQALVGLLADGGQRLVNEACKSNPAFLDLGPRQRMNAVNGEMAHASYDLADAMLAERAKGGDA